MPPDLLASVPAEHRDRAAAALTAVLTAGATPTITPYHGGASGALTYRVDVDGRSLLLRIETARDTFRNPHRSYPCLVAAAAAGIAPAVHHADAGAGVVVMDLIDERPHATHPGGAPAIVAELGSLIGRLQALAPFPPLLADFPTVLDGMLGFLTAGGVFAAGVLDPHRAAFDRLRAAYPWAPEQVASHNDPNPGNVLSDGTRLWLVDWELAFRADPMVDIALVAEGMTLGPDLEVVLLGSWLGHDAGTAADAVLQARLTVMRRFARLYYACLMLTMEVGRRPTQPDATSLGLEGFQAALASGRLALGHPDLLFELGKLQLAGFLVDLDKPSFGGEPSFADVLATARG